LGDLDHPDHRDDKGERTVRRVAIITAAGFKGVSTEFPDVPRLCPEPLLPIGEEHGGTVLARLARQLGNLGFEVFATVGEPGYVFNWRPPWNADHFEFRYDPATTTQSPWTQERIEQVARYSTPLTVPDPDETSYHDSAFLALDKIGYEWDQCLITQGDHLFTDALLEDVVALLPFPCQFRASRTRPFSVLLLTPEAARAYRRLGDSFRGAGEHMWNGSPCDERGIAPQGEEFARAAPIIYLTDVFSHHHEYEVSDDIDCPDDYVEALVWLQRGGCPRRELEITHGC
jgi:hypothetical protein